MDPQLLQSFIEGRVGATAGTSSNLLSFFVVSTAFYMMDVIYYDALGWQEMPHTAAKCPP